jgi:hypothetical protein
MAAVSCGRHRSIERSDFWRGRAVVGGDGARCLPRAGQEVTGPHAHHRSPPSGPLDSHLTSLSGSRFERMKGHSTVATSRSGSLCVHPFLTLGWGYSFGVFSSVGRRQQERMQDGRTGVRLFAARRTAGPIQCTAYHLNRVINKFGPIGPAACYPCKLPYLPTPHVEYRLPNSAT